MNGTVRVSMGYTLQPKKFESMRIDIEITDESLPGEKAAEAFDRVYNFVENKLVEKVIKAKQDLDVE